MEGGEGEKEEGREEREEERVRGEGGERDVERGKQNFSRFFHLTNFQLWSLKMFML